MTHGDALRAYHLLFQQHALIDTINNAVASANLIPRRQNDFSPTSSRVQTTAVETWILSTCGTNSQARLMIEQVAILIIFDQIGILGRPRRNAPSRSSQRRQRQHRVYIQLQHVSKTRNTRSLLIWLRRRLNICLHSGHELGDACSSLRITRVRTRIVHAFHVFSNSNPEGEFVILLRR